MLLKVSLDGFALLSKLGSGLGEENDRSRDRINRSHRRVGTLEHLQHTADVVCQVVEPNPEFSLRVGPENLVQLVNSSCIRINPEELIAQQRLQFRRRCVERHGRLQYLENPRFVMETNTTLLFGRLPEFRKLPPGPL